MIQNKELKAFALLFYFRIKLFYHLIKSWCLLLTAQYNFNISLVSIFSTVPKSRGLVISFDYINFHACTVACNRKLQHNHMQYVTGKF